MNDIRLNPTEAKKVKDAVQEMVNCLIRIDSEKESMNDIAEMIQKKYGIRKSLLNKVAKAHHTHKYSQIQQENEQFETIYESLIETSSEETTDED